jgi:hypothetical protein
MGTSPDASNRNSASLRCIVCERVIADDHWFGRFNFGHDRLFVCCPFCMEKFLDHEDVYATKLGVPLPVYRTPAHWS